MRKKYNNNKNSQPCKSAMTGRNEMLKIIMRLLALRVMIEPSPFHNSMNNSMTCVWIKTVAVNFIAVPSL